MFMNKKVLTLCAGFLLAGGLANFANAEDVVLQDISQKVGYLQGNGNYFFFVSNDNVYGFEENADGTYKEKVAGLNWTIDSEDVKDFLWTVDSVALDGAAQSQWAYRLVNAATGKQLVFTKGTDKKAGDWVSFTATPDNEYDTKGYFIFENGKKYNDA